MTRTYRFGEFRLDPATRELRRGDAPVAVPPRAFDCIVYLLEHRERAVGRDELIAAVWGRTETGDGTLGQTVLAARRALEDTGKEQHVIRTVFRFGYHWVAPVDVVDEAPAEAASGKPPAPDIALSATTAEPERASAEGEASASATIPAQTRRKRTLLGAAIVVVALALGAFALHEWRAARTASSGGPSASASAIALVLPVTVTAGSGYDWVRLGLMDLIGSRLRAAGLPVVPSDNVVALTGSSGGALDIAGLARATGANLVVEARAEAIGARWRVTLRTVRGRDPPLSAVGEAADVLAAARSAADTLARQLGYAPVAEASGGSVSLAVLSQQIEAAMLSDRLAEARALIASATPEQRDLPELRLRLAQIDYQGGDLDAAEAGFEAVAKAAPAEQDAVLHARAITNLGVIAAIRDNNPLAMRRFDEAIADLRREHAMDALGKALNGRAGVSSLGNDYDAALRDFAEARAAFESTGNLLALAVLDSNLAAMDMRRYRYAEAEPAFVRAAERFATFGVNAAELNALTGAAELRLALLQADAALALEPRLRELIAKVADPARQRAGELTRIEVLAANGRTREAVASLGAALDAASAADDRAAMARGHTLAARLAMARGDADGAVRESESALQRFTAADDARERVRAFRLCVVALIATGRAAGATLAALGDFAAHDSTPPARMYFDLASADSAAAAGESAAGKLYAQAMAEADALRIPLDLRETAGAYADWLVRQGDLAAAGATVERIAGWASRDFDSALVQLRVQRALGDPSLWRSALTRAQPLAGERAIPADLLQPPGTAQR